MKSFLGLRPMYVYNTDHIRGHVILCVLALILIRLLQERLSEFGEHLSIRDITEPELPGVPSTQISSELDAQITL